MILGGNLARDQQAYKIWGQSRQLAWIPPIRDQHTNAGIVKTSFSCICHCTGNHFLNTNVGMSLVVRAWVAPHTFHRKYVCLQQFHTDGSHEPTTYTVGIQAWHLSGLRRLLRSWQVAGVLCKGTPCLFSLSRSTTMYANSATSFSVWIWFGSNVITIRVSTRAVEVTFLLLRCDPWYLTGLGLTSVAR